MKRILLFLSLIIAFISLTPDVKAQSANFGAYINGTKGAVGTALYGSATAGYIDTLSEADTTIYQVSIKGPKHNVTFQIDVLKISGTITGAIQVYGSANGTTYETAVVTTATTVTDASVNYVIKFTSNQYSKYMVKVISASGSGGTDSYSNRCYLLYREQP